MREKLTTVRTTRHNLTTLTAIVVTLALVILDVSFGHRFYSLSEIAAAIAGNADGGLTFMIVTLRLPRALTALACGAGFGLAGIAFQTLLGNILASPDIIGITAGANLAAVASITVFGLSGLPLFALAVGGGVATAILVLVLSLGRGTLGTRFILIGIGIAALMNAATSWLLVRADHWDIQVASRWLTGSLSDVQWSDVAPAGIAAVCGLVLLEVFSRPLDLMRFGVPTATGLGVRVGLSRAVIIVVAVAVLSIATATTGPIAFVSFLAGPIATRLIGSTRPPLVAAAAIGASLVIAADIIAQHMPSGRLPVGVMTSLVGGPVLILLVVRLMRKES